MPECIFCDHDPCECSKPARKVRKAAPKPPVQKKTLSDGPVLRVGSNTDLPTFQPPSIPTVKSEPALVMEAEDAEWWATVRALAPIIDEQELFQYSQILASSPTRTEKVVAWKRLFSWRRSQRG